MIKLSQPKAYDEIKPLHGSNGQPIRCTPLPPAQIPIPEIEDRVDCTECRTKACQTGACDQ